MDTLKTGVSWLDELMPEGILVNSSTISSEERERSFHHSVYKNDLRKPPGFIDELKRKYEHFFNSVTERLE